MYAMLFSAIVGALFSQPDPIDTLKRILSFESSQPDVQWYGIVHPEDGAGYLDVPPHLSAAPLDKLLIYEFVNGLKSVPEFLRTAYAFHATCVLKVDRSTFKGEPPQSLAVDLIALDHNRKRVDCAPGELLFLDPAASSANNLVYHTDLDTPVMFVQGAVDPTQFPDIIMLKAATDGTVIGAWPNPASSQPTRAKRPRPGALRAARRVEEPLPSVCQVHWDSSARWRFAYGSILWLQTGADREQVLQALLAIARLDNPGNDTNIAAVRSAFHVADTDARIREALLSIIEDRSANGNAVSVAINLIPFVADADTAKRLREMATTTWPYGHAQYVFDALAELGDAGTLEWIEKRLASPLGELEPTRRWFERIARSIRVQRDIASMIAEIQDENSAIDGGWLVRQAMRHGASAAQVRTATLSYIDTHQNALRGPQAWRCGSLVRACDEYEILSRQDEEREPGLKRVRDVNRPPSRDPVAEIRWATLIPAKRAAFYRLPHAALQPDSSAAGLRQAAASAPAASGHSTSPDRAALRRLLEWSDAHDWRGISLDDRNRQFAAKACEMQIFDADTCARLAVGGCADRRP